MMAFVFMYVVFRLLVSRKASKSPNGSDHRRRATGVQHDSRALSRRSCASGLLAALIMLGSLRHVISAQVPASP